MPSTQSRGEPVFPFDPKLTRTLHRMNSPHNLVDLSDEINFQPPPPIDAQNQVIVENPCEGAMMRQPSASHPQEYYRGNVNITDFEGPLVLPPLPLGHTFMVTSSLMQMLTARGLFLRLPSEDLQDHIAKLRLVCKSFIRRPDLNMDVIGLRVFPLSLMGEAVIWFTKISYNSIYIWNQLRDVFLAPYYLVSKKRNHKDRVNNFVELLGESVRSLGIGLPHS